MEHDIGHLPLEPAGGLVDHDSGVWQGEPLTSSPPAWLSVVASRYSSVNLVLLWDEFISKFRFLIAIGFLSRRKTDFFVRNFFIRNQAEEMRNAV